MLIKVKPDNYKFASPGNGTIPHLVGAMFIDAAEPKLQHDPYKGAAPMIADLLGGQVDFGVAAVSSVQAHLNAGTLRAVSATGATCVPSLASIPTLEKQGFDVTVGGWMAAIGPARRAPAEVVAARRPGGRVELA